MPSDYARIEKALGYIAANAEAQPDLDAVAAEIGLSPFHFQRLFTRWVGVSPKKFLQYLTLERAKSCLAGAASVLDATHEVGLSGPGRLHDLFVTHEAVTPGEFKRRGEGLEIAHGWVESQFGEALILGTPRGVCGLAFAHANSPGGGRKAAFDDMRARFPKARFVEDPKRAAKLARTIFARERGAGERLNLVLHGSPFQIKVWEALLRVPPGALVSYDTVAHAVFGSGSGARAVAGAVADNPISFLIPCHRVIRKSGALGDYHWGAARKRAILGWEAVRAEGAAPAVAA